MAEEVTYMTANKRIMGHMDRGVCVSVKNVEQILLLFHDQNVLTQISFLANKFSN